MNGTAVGMEEMDIYEWHCGGKVGNGYLLLAQGWEGRKLIFINGTAVGRSEMGIY